jgi:hypothetical protein
LSPTQHTNLQALLSEYGDIFAQSSSDLGRSQVATHRIDTGDHSPVNVPPYRLSPANRDEIERQIHSMMQSGVVRPSRSPWASPVVLVDKPDGSKRFCVDYRKVNACTKKDRYPIPRVDDSLDILSGKQYFTTLDLMSGYWQIPLAEDDIEKTAFITPVGLFEFTTMPFGLCNAPSSFQRAMDSVLAGLKWRSCIVYLDDILVFSDDFESHLQDLAAVFQRIRDSRLKLKPSKCKFAEQELRYLGYLVTPTGLRVDPAKVQAVTALSVPANKSQLRSFLGLTSYYRRFVPAYAAIAEPLTRLLRDQAPFQWTVDQQCSFDHLKQQPTSAPILIHPDWKKPFLLQTDASDFAVAAVLAQIGDDGLEHVVSYASRQLTPSERKYDTRQKELLAVLFGCESFSKYLLGSHFTVETDHANLRWLKLLIHKVAV